MKKVVIISNLTDTEPGILPLLTVLSENSKISSDLHTYRRE